MTASNSQPNDSAHSMVAEVSKRLEQQRESFLKRLEAASSKYSPLIEDELRKSGIDLEKLKEEIKIEIDKHKDKASILNILDRHKPQLEKALKSLTPELKKIQVVDPADLANNIKVRTDEFGCTSILQDTKK